MKRCLLPMILGTLLGGHLARAQEGLTIEAIAFGERGYWEEWSGMIDLTDEIDAIKQDVAAHSSGETDGFESHFYTDAPGFGDVMNGLYDPEGRLLEKASYLILGDSGRLLEITLTVKNHSDVAIRIDAMQLVLDDFLARNTSRGDGSLELEGLTLEPDPVKVQLPWPTGYFATSRDDHRRREETLTPLKSEPGYNSTRTVLKSSLVILPETTQKIEIAIPTRFYPHLGFGCSHYLMHLELEAGEKSYPTQKIYWVGSHWWMFQ